MLQAPPAESIAPTQQWSPNPWGCWARVDNPHHASSQPGYIHAYGWIYDCLYSVPQSAKRRIELSLYRSSWSGWRWVRTTLFKCPEATNGALCYGSGNMRGILSWNCDVTGYYNYLVVGYIYIDYQGTRYEANVQRQTGPVNQDGTVYCFE